MRGPTRTTLHTLCIGVMLARPSDVLTLPAPLRRLASKERGMATAEYAIGTLTAVASVGLSPAFMCSGSLSGALQSTIGQVLSV